MDSELCAVVCDLFDCLAVCLRYSLTIMEIRNIKTKLFRIMARFYDLLPKTEWAIVFHLLLHVPDMMLNYGPASSYWLYPYERYIAFLSKCVRHRYHVEASLLGFYSLFNHSVHVPKHVMDMIQSFGINPCLLQPIGTKTNTVLTARTVEFPASTKLFLDTRSDDLIVKHIRLCLAKSDKDYEMVYDKYEKWIEEQPLSRSVPSLEEWCSSNESDNYLNNKEKITGCILSTARIGKLIIFSHISFPLLHLCLALWLHTINLLFHHHHYLYICASGIFSSTSSVSISALSSSSSSSISSLFLSFYFTIHEVCSSTYHIFCFSFM